MKNAVPLLPGRHCLQTCVLSTTRSQEGHTEFFILVTVVCTHRVLCSQATRSPACTPGLYISSTCRELSSTTTPSRIPVLPTATTMEPAWTTYRATWR